MHLRQELLKEESEILLASHNFFFLKKYTFVMPLWLSGKAFEWQSLRIIQLGPIEAQE